MFEEPIEFFPVIIAVFRVLAAPHNCSTIFYAFQGVFKPFFRFFMLWGVFSIPYFFIKAYFFLVHIENLISFTSSIRFLSVFA